MLALVRFRHLNVLWLVRALIVALPLAALLWLLRTNLIIAETRTLVYEPGEKPTVIRPASGSLEATLTDTGPLAWRLAGDELVFSVQAPRPLDRIRAEVYLHNTNQPSILFGAKQPNGTFDDQSIVRFALLDTLEWPRLAEKQQSLWQRPLAADGTGPTQFPSVEAFLQGSYDSRRVGVFGFNPLQFYRDDTYVPAREPVTFRHTLRGAHELYVYAADEDLSLTFDKVDLNRSVGADTVTIEVWRDGERVYHETAGDDGIESDNRDAGAPQTVRVRVPKVPAGLYRVLLKTDNEVLLRNLTFGQHRFAFSSHIFFADGPVYGGVFSPIELQTHGSELVVETPHEEGVQTFTVDEKKHELAAVKKTVTVMNPAGTGSRVRLSRGDVYVASQGLISIAPALNFYPQGAQVLSLSEPFDFNQVDYVFAGYRPRPTNGGVVARDTFRPEKIHHDGNVFTFKLQAPGLYAGRFQLEVEKIRVFFDAEPYGWRRAFNTVQKFFTG